jgi:hypothetical protein
MFPSGVKPDAVDGRTVYLIKACSRLRLTRQIRMATFMAAETGRCLQLRVRSDCELSGDLEEFIEQNRAAVEIVRA